MKKILIILFFIPYCSSFLNGQSSNPEYWKEIKQPNSVKYGSLFIVTGLKVNDKGTILAFGYTNESHSTFDNLYGNLQYLKLKIFRSKDNAKTWEDISNKELGILDYQLSITPYEAFTNGNFSVLGNKFFINFVNGYFVSEDDGITWKKILNDQKTNGTYLFYVDENTRIGVHPGKLGFMWPYYAIYKKEGGNWISVVDATKDIYFYRPPFPIISGNKFAIYDMIKGDKFAGMDYPFYSYPKNNFDRILPCEQVEIDKVGTNYSNCFSPPLIYKSEKSNNVLYLVSGSNNSSALGYASTIQIYRSTDKGQTFNRIKLPEIYRAILNIFPVCDNGTLITLCTRITGNLNETKRVFVASHDNGNTWEELGVYPELNAKNVNKFSYDDRIKDIILMNDGRYLVGGTAGLHVSTEKVSCGSTTAHIPEEKKVTYGTTVITHGFQLGGEPPFKDKDWAFQMALEVLKNAENGTIYTYDKKTGNYDESITLADGKKGEKILLYDWASESNNSGLGYSEAAGDALFTSLLLGFKKEQFGLSNIHFIGHSRGTVVNTLTSERLLVLKSNYPKSEYKDKILIDQVTNISPHDWGIAVSFDDIDPIDLKSVSNKQYVLTMSDLNDAHPDINIDDPIDYKPNNGVIAWKGLFNDTYWQEHGKLIEKKKWEKSISVEDLIDALKTAMTPTPYRLNLVWANIKLYVKSNFNIEYTNLNDRRVAGSHNSLWADDEKGQYTLHAGERGVYNVYNKTIKGMPPLYGSGYQFSRLAKKKIQRPNDGYGLGIPTFDFYKNMNLKGKNNSRILGIMNGSFDRYSDIDAPGWSEHGGKMLGESNETTDNRGIKKGKPAFDFS